MAIDLDEALNAPPGKRESAGTQRDVLLRDFSLTSAQLLPGENIRAEAWWDGDRLLLRSTCPGPAGAPVLTAEVSS